MLLWVMSLEEQIGRNLTTEAPSLRLFVNGIGDRKLLDAEPTADASTSAPVEGDVVAIATTRTA